jgi:cytochrome c oxidase subunit 2
MRRWQRAGTGSRAGVVALVVAGALVLAGCGQYPAATEQGEPVHRLYDIMFVVATPIFLLVEGLILWAVLRYRRKDDVLPPQFHGNNLLEIGWTIGPLIIVAVLFVLSFQVINKVDALPANPQATVNILGFQWQWQFTYAGEKVTVERGQPPQDLSVKGTIAKPPHIYLPVGERIRFNEQSKDVIHSFYIPEFLYKRDLVPGRTNHFELTIAKAGVYHGQCAQFCGLAHGQMHFYVHAVSRPEFDKWLADQKKRAESGCPEDTSPGQISAKSNAYDKECLAEPADKPFTLAFNNQDAGVPHNVVIFKGKDATGEPQFRGQLFPGPGTQRYQVKALPAGRYFYHCDAHPDAMTGTLVVK